MRKGGKYSKIQPKPDYKYNRIDIGRFINYIMKQGKKSVAEKVFYNALGEVEKKTKQNTLDVFDKELDLSEEKERVIKSLLSKDLNSELNSELNNIDRGTDA